MRYSFFHRNRDTTQPGSGSGSCDVVTISKDVPLWFFGYGISVPTGFTQGSTNATLTANNASTGTFAWTITAGTSKLQLENGSTTMTKTNVNTVGISTKYYSSSTNDVT